MGLHCLQIAFFLTDLKFQDNNITDLISLVGAGEGVTSYMEQFRDVPLE